MADITTQETTEEEHIEDDSKEESAEDEKEDEEQLSEEEKENAKTEAEARYLEIKGMVFPSSIRVTTLLTYSSFCPSSWERISEMEIIYGLLTIFK